MIFLNNFDVFVEGFLKTLQLAGMSFALALPLGVVLALMRTSPVGILRGTGGAYVEIFRNTPLTVLLFFSAFVLPVLGFSLSYFLFAVIGLTAYYAAFFCEAVRSGLNTIPIGQAEAARSIGLSTRQMLWYVIMPQAFRNALPAVVNVVIALIKSTAIASAFGVAESISSMELLIFRHSDSVISILIVTCLLYLAITIPLGRLAAFMEQQSAGHGS